MVEKKQAIRDYKEGTRQHGVFRVRNRASGMSLLGAATDLPSALNRHRAQLKFGAHPCKPLQQDWNALGDDQFDFEVLDELEIRKDAASEPKDELKLLEDMWRERLSAAAEPLYPFRGPIR